MQLHYDNYLIDLQIEEFFEDLWVIFQVLSRIRLIFKDFPGI